MPQLVTIRVRGPQGGGVRLWIPLLPVLLILSPIVVLATVIAAAACVAYRVNPVRAFWSGWRLLCALRGTRVDVAQGRSTVLVQIS